MQTNVGHVHSMEPRHEFCFSLAGMRCVLRTESDDVRAALASNADLPRGSRQGFALHVKVDREIAPHIPGDAHFRGLHHLAFALFGEEVFLFDLVRREVHASVSPQTARNGEFWRRTILPIALGTLGLAVGVVPLHSACLDWQGAGFLVAGLSGAGKSTLAVALAKAGLTLVSDDWTYVCESGAELVAHGLDAPVKLLPDAILHFPELADYTTHRSFNGEIAYEVAAGQAFNAGAATRTDPRAVLLLNREAAPGLRIRECPGAEVKEYYERSAERVPTQLAHLAAMRSRVIDRIAALPCFTITYGGDPLGAACEISAWWRGRL